MARIMEKLSPVAVRNANKPGMYGDGGGLWLHVGPNAIGPDGNTKTGTAALPLTDLLNEPAGWRQAMADFVARLPRNTEEFA